MAEQKMSGRVWVLLDEGGKLIENIDTDQIYHNAHLPIADLEKMGQYALGNLKGWEDFPQKVKPGDILVAGRNFGAGSSRQQAVDCFLSLKVGAILAPSFGAIYFRNAVNSGFPILRCPELKNLVDEGLVESGDEVSLHFLSGRGEIENKRKSFRFIPMSSVQYDIHKAGGLYNYGREQE
jgi:3-isopropylmalate/(R)-2-methylmalate dehydratase small subunit